jgi:2-oxo-3-hexenedioate decarboxylase
MSGWNVQRAATALLAADIAGIARAPLTDDWPDLDVDMAYAVQEEALARRLARGERLVGVKIDLTAAPEQPRQGAGCPVTAWLTDAMVLPTGAPLPRGTLIQPRVEPEIAFLLGRGLSGPGVTAATAMRAVAAVYGALEVGDSRYAGHPSRLPDVVADNGSAAFHVLGPLALPAQGLDLSLEACLVEVDGSVVDSATGASVMGHPAEALALASNVLGSRGVALEEGWIVLTGGMTDAVAVESGSRIAAHFTHLGSIVLSGG